MENETKNNNPAKKFVKKMYDKHYRNPFNENEFVTQHGKDRIAMIHMSSSGEKEAHIHYFRTHPQRSGVGTEALKNLQKHATEHGVSLHLHLDERSTTPKKVLHKFYNKHGFKGNHSMTWHPPKNEINEEGVMGGAPTNSVGSGAIAGIGIGPDGEPGRKSVMGRMRRKVDAVNRIVKAKCRKDKNK